MTLTLGLGLGLSQSTGQQWEGNSLSQEITDESATALTDESSNTLTSSGD